MAQSFLHAERAARAAAREGSWLTDHRPAASRSRVARSGLWPLVGALTAGIFAIDLWLPLGIAGGVPYVVPVLLTMWLPDRRYMMLTALVCSVLTAAGFAFSTAGAPLWAVIPNRTLALVAIWTVALLAWKRRHAEDVLAEREALLRAVLATTAEAVLTLDENGRIVLVNPVAERIFGLSAAALAERSLGDLLEAPDRSRFDRDPQAYLSEIASRADVTPEIVGRRDDGTTFPMEILVTPLNLPTGARYTAMLRDVSKRRRQELHLLSASEEERKAVGYSLHEELGQMLTGLGLLSRHLASRLEADHPDEAREAADLASLLHEADGMALRLFGDLVPVDASGGLARALSRFVCSAAEKHGARCTVEADASVPLADDVHAPQLYRIVRELTHALLEGGRVAELGLRLDGSGGRSSFVLGVRGEELLPPDRLADTLQQLSYRAKLIGARLETDVHERGEIAVRCTF